MDLSCRKRLAKCLVLLLEAAELLGACRREGYEALEKMPTMVRRAARGDEMEEKLNFLVESDDALESAVSNISKVIG